MIYITVFCLGTIVGMTYVSLVHWYIENKNKKK